MNDKLNNLLVSPTDSTLVQLFRYFFVGGAAFAVDFFLLYTFTEFLKINYLISAALSFIAGLLVNYIISIKWVFAKKGLKNKKVEFLLFAVIGVIGLGFNELIIWIFTDFFKLYYMVSKIISAAIVYMWNFGARKYILYKK